MNAVSIPLVPVRQGLQSRSRLTRARIVTAAGEVFAQQGLHAAIGRQIAERAGISVPSINYHFGGMDGLYHAVLEAAYAHVIATSLFAEAMSDAKTPERQLFAVCSAMVSSFAEDEGNAWQWRVISREAMSPSPALAEAREVLLIPKILMFRDMVSALLELPCDHPAVVQGCLAVMAPIVLMQVGDWAAIGRAFGGFGITRQNAAEVAQSFHAFTLGGLRAIAASYRSESTS